MSKTLETLRKNMKVEHVDDLRDSGNGVVVTLAYAWRWDADPDCTLRAFDTVAEALRAVRNETHWKQERYTNALVEAIEGLKMNVEASIDRHWTRAVFRGPMGQLQLEMVFNSNAKPEAVCNLVKLVRSAI